MQSGGRDNVEPSAALNSIFKNVKNLNVNLKQVLQRESLKIQLIMTMEPQESDDTVECFHVPHGTKRFFAISML